jgi:hypothetical protein
MPLLHVERHGHIPDEEAGSIIALLEEFYGRLRPDRLDLVEIMLFENDSLWRGYASFERRKAGVSSAEFDDAFIAAHEAWTGIPRISISLKRKQDLAPLVWEGALRHEAGHSILHGSLEYYALPMPIALQRAGENFTRLVPHLRDILYLLSLAIKDMEVTRLLTSNGYIEDQVAYARFTMKASQQDIDAWALASLAPEARALCLVGRMKDIAAGIMLANRSQHPRIDLGEVEESLGYLNRSLRNRLLDTMTEVSRGLGNDTLGNIEMVGRLLVANIIEPIMSHPSVGKPS